MNISIINKYIVGAAAASLLAIAPAFAKTIKPPNDEFAVGSIEFPGSCEPEEIHNGVARDCSDRLLVAP